MDQIIPDDSHGQFAYHKNRSCELNVAIGLDRAERYGYPCVALGLDSRKAFDTCPFKATAQVLHKRCGGGYLWYNYTRGRNYKFRGKLGFQKEPMGRGAPPGSILAPKAFAAFQTTDTEMTLKNSTMWLLWAGLFSDDKGPITPMEAVKDGRFQTALDSTSKWTEDNFVDYHLSGKKGPKYFVYRRKGQTFDLEATENLFLHRFSEDQSKKTRVERGYVNWQLGFCQVFPRDDEESNQYGYKLHWTATNKGKPTLARLAHRFDHVKYVWDPDWTRVCQRSYLESNIQYGAALYWLRADKADIEKVRYYYTMGLAACMGLEAAEIVSVNSAARERVTDHAQKFYKACEFLNLPTIKDLAIKNAKHILRQWAIYEPGRFVFDQEGKLTGLSDEFETGLLADMFKLSREPVNDWYPDFNKKKDDPLSLAGLARKDREAFPLYKRYYFGAVCANKVIFDDSVIPTQVENINTYILMCRNYFKVLEESHRRLKRLGIHGKIGYVAKKRPREAGNDNANAKRTRMGDCLRCSDPMPARAGKKKVPCRVCGYAITARARFVQLDCCSSRVHTVCFIASSGLRAQDLDAVEKVCSRLKNFLEKDKATVYENTVRIIAPQKSYSQVCAGTPKRVRDKPQSSSQPANPGGPPPVPCRYGCGLMISISDTSHYLYECNSLSRFFDPGGDVDYTRVTPLARRAASMTRVRPLTPRVPIPHGSGQ